MGVRPASEVSVVIKIGRTRLATAARTASTSSSPSRRRARAPSTTRMALFTTTPSRIKKPSAVIRSRGCGESVASTRRSAPMPPAAARGTVTSTTTGARKSSKSALRSRKEITSANRSTSAKRSFARSRSPAAPAISTRTPGGSVPEAVCSSTMRRMRSMAVSRGSVSGGETSRVSARRRSMRWMVIGPSSSRASARTPRGTTSPEPATTGAERMASRSSMASPSRTARSTTSSRGWPGGESSPTIAPSATASTIRPSVSVGVCSGAAAPRRGWKRSSGVPGSRLGTGRTCAPSSSPRMAPKSAPPAPTRSPRSAPVICTSTVRPPPRRPKREACVVKAK